MSSFVKSIVSVLTLGFALAFSAAAHSAQPDAYGCSGSQQCGNYNAELYNGG